MPVLVTVVALDVLQAFLFLLVLVLVAPRTLATVLRGTSLSFVLAVLVLSRLSLSIFPFFLSFSVLAVLVFSFSFLLSFVPFLAFSLVVESQSVRVLLCSLAILLLESKDFKVGVIELQGSFKLLHRVHSCV